MAGIRHEVATRGIVVARIPAGEGSLRVLMYTEALGLVAALAKSAREERSQLRAHLQTGTLGTFMLVKGRDAWRVMGATATENLFAPLSGDAAEAAARTLSAVRRFAHGAGADPYLWRALAGFAQAVARGKDAWVLEHLAVFRLFAALGYVRESAATREFFDVSYEPDTLARARAARAPLVRAVNEAISASGL